MVDFEEMLGVYVGGVGIAEAIATLGDNTPGEWLVQVENGEGHVILLPGPLYVSEALVEDDERACWFVVPRAAATRDGNPRIYEPVQTFILVFAKNDERPATMSLYSGGLVIEPVVGAFKGHKLGFAIWHSAMHETESGGFAPGFGEIDDEGEES